jgi:hypothetical protein
LSYTPSKPYRFTSTVLDVMNAPINRLTTAPNTQTMHNKDCKY